MALKVLSTVLPRRSRIKWQTLQSFSSFEDNSKKNETQIQKLQNVAEKLGLNLTSDDLEEYEEIVRKIIGPSKKLSELEDACIEPKYPRKPGYRPSAEENIYNAWYYKTDIQGTTQGRLHGKKVAIKDNIGVAGVPMMCGSQLLEGYVPQYDATVVTRVLDAGGVISGKATCENLCFSASSFTSSSGPVLNPVNTKHSAGGSSSGCAALISSREVDLAIGSDQGGSIRVPSAWCGIVGHKPTYGLVPCTGAMTLETSLDHLGPMARTVQDCALLLEVIAGYDDGRDPRQHPHTPPQQYTQQLTTDLSGVKVAILKESLSVSKPDVSSIVSDSAGRLAELNATVTEVSIPIHAHASAIFGPIFLNGASNTLNNMGLNIGFKGFQDPALWRFLNKYSQSRMKDLPPTVKLLNLVAESLKENGGIEVYARAMNLLPKLTSAYNDILNKYDIIVSPTTRFTSPKLPDQDINIKDYIRQALNMTSLTEPFNATGHPALSVNAGYINGLPVGMMMVAKHFDDATALKVGHAWEKLRDGLA